MAILVCFLLTIFEHEIASVFSQKGMDVAGATKVLPIICFINLFDMLLSYFLGCARALSKQSEIALFAFVSFYMISMPAAAYLAFVSDASITGLWLGYLFGMIVFTAIVAEKTIYSNWQLVANDVEKQIMRDYSEAVRLLTEDNPSIYLYSNSDLDNDGEESNTLLETEVASVKGMERDLLERSLARSRRGN